jgi:group I intron endonuclease
VENKYEESKMNTQYQIYITTNTINGKKYIGLDSKCSDSYLGSGILIKEAIKKYGKSNFEKNILAETDNIYYANILERLFIAKFDAVNSDNFYNLSYGGEFISGRAHSVDTIIKISKSKKKNYINNDILRYNVGSANRGKRIPETTKLALIQANTGRQMSDLTKSKIGERARIRYKTEGLVYPSLINTMTGEIIESGINLSTLADRIGVSKGNLSQLIKGKRLSCKKWRVVK